MSQTVNLNELFQSSKASGDISADSLNLLSLPDLGAKIQQGLGVSVDDIPASEVFLLSVLVDDSGSIEAAGNTQLVIDGYNTIIAALKESKQESSILVHTRYLNGTVLCPYMQLANAAAMSTHNYQANGGTPLYDEAVALLGTVIAKTQEFADNGVPARSVSIIITDGEDVHSHKHRVTDVRSLVDDMLRSETHIVAALGLNNGHTDFRKVFKQMGIDPKWILTPGADKKDVRGAFRVISQTAARTSQGRGQFSRAAVGGFGG